MKLGGFLELSLFLWVRFFFFLVHLCVCLHVQVSGGGSYQNQRLSFQSRKASSPSLLISTLNTLINALERDPVFWLLSPFRRKQFGMEQQNQGQKMGRQLGQSHHSTDQSHRFYKSTLFWSLQGTGDQCLSLISLSLLAKSVCKCIPMFPYLFRASFCHNVSSP